MNSFMKANREACSLRMSSKGADVTGLAFEIFDFLDAFLRHDLIRKDIDPRGHQNKRRRAFEGGRNESGGARSRRHLHFAGEHRLHRGRSIGLDDFNVEPVFWTADSHDARQYRRASPPAQRSFF